jgi:hypothetical protein
VKEQLLAGPMGVIFVNPTGKSSNKYEAKWSVVVQLKVCTPEVNNNVVSAKSQANKTVNNNTITSALPKTAQVNNQVKTEDTLLHDAISISSGN